MAANTSINIKDESSRFKVIPCHSFHISSHQCDLDSRAGNPLCRELLFPDEASLCEETFQ